MPKFIADGGDGYEMFKDAKIRPYGKYASDLWTNGKCSFMSLFI